MSPRRPTGRQSNVRPQAKRAFHRPPFSGSSGGGTGDVGSGDGESDTSRAQMLATTDHPPGAVEASSGVTGSVAQAYSHING